MRRWMAIIVSLMLISLLAACGNGGASGKTKDGKKAVVIGYFPNLTHITTIIGLEKGYFDKSFGDTKIKTKTFTQGGLFMEALATDAIDIGTTGPSPVINYYAKEPKYRIISGAANGGAVLVANKQAKVRSLKDLDGKKVAIPGVGNTQDIMLRKALKSTGLKAKMNGGTVDLHPAAPADTTTLFKQGSVDAAASPEPWGYVLERDQGGKVLLDWEDFAWGKKTPVTVVATTESFLKDKVKTAAFLKAHEQAIRFIQEEPEAAQKLVIKHIKDLTGKELDDKEVAAAFSRLEVSDKSDKEVMREMAEIAKEAKYINDSNIKNMVDLKHLNNLE